MSSEHLQNILENNTNRKAPKQILCPYYDILPDFITWVKTYSSTSNQEWKNLQLNNSKTKNNSFYSNIFITSTFCVLDINNGNVITLKMKTKIVG